MRAADLKGSHRPILKFLSGLSLHDWVRDTDSIVSVTGSRPDSVLIFLSVNTQALSDKIDLDTLNMLNQPCDRR